MTPDCVSLEHVLSGKCPFCFATGLSKREYLCVLVNLASSLLQLHGTPWLSENWNNECVHFWHPANEEELYVAVKFATPPATEKRCDSFTPNPYLVALGIIFLELSQKKLFSGWLKTRNWDLPEEVMNRANYAIAWLKEAFNQGKIDRSYATIVQRCLTSAFDPVVCSNSLEDEELREAVYHKILEPLKKEYLIAKNKLTIIKGVDYVL